MNETLLNIVCDYLCSHAECAYTCKALYYMFILNMAYQAKHDLCDHSSEVHVLSLLTHNIVHYLCQCNRHWLSLLLLVCMSCFGGIVFTHYPSVSELVF